MRLWLFLPIHLPNSFWTPWLISDNSQQTHTVGGESVLPKKQLLHVSFYYTIRSPHLRGIIRKVLWTLTTERKALVTPWANQETNPGDFTDQRGMGLQYLPPVFQHDSPTKGTVCCQLKKIKDWFCVATKRDRATCSGILGGMFTQPPVCQLLQVCSHTVTAPLTDPAENQHRKDNFQTGEAEGRVSPSLFTSMGRTMCLW